MGMCSDRYDMATFKPKVNKHFPGKRRPRHHSASDLMWSIIYLVNKKNSKILEYNENYGEISID